MNFTEAVKRLYGVAKNEEWAYITRKDWERSASKHGRSFFWALCIDSNLDLRPFQMDSNGKCTGKISHLHNEDYLADDWAIFDIGRWEIQEGQDETGD
jgi:hypothetical protein